MNGKLFIIAYTTGKYDISELYVQNPMQSYIISHLERYLLTDIFDEE